MKKTTEETAKKGGATQDVASLGFTAEELEGSSLLVIGEGGEAIISVFLAHSAKVEHLAFSKAEAENLKCRYPDRTVHLGDEASPLSKIPKKRFRFVALFGKYPSKISDHLLLLLMDSCGDAFILEDPYALEPGERYGHVSTCSLGWASRRFDYLRRQIQTLRLNDIRVNETLGNPIYVCRKGALKPVLVNVHIPKCGGLTIVDAMFKSFGLSAVHILPFHPPWAPGEVGGLHAQFAANPNLRAISSHLLKYSFPSVIGDRSMLYFTMLRNPLKQFQSLVRFQKYNSTLYDIGVGRAWRAAFQPNMRLTEIADICMSEPDIFLQSLPSRFLTNAHSAGHYISILQRFTFIGVVERFEDSMWLAERTFAEYGLPFKYERGSRRNASEGESLAGQSIPTDYAEQEEELRNYQPLIDFVNREAVMDFEIHRWATKRFEKDFRLMKEKLGEA